MLASPLERAARAAAAVFAVVAALVAFAAPAAAIPSFSRQTGQECSTCHVGAYGPQLTPYGIRFKIGGYTEANTADLRNFVSAMAVATYTHTAKAQNPPPDPFRANDNAVLQEASVFFAGRITDHLGMFAQVTYSGVDRKLALDAVDLRSAFETEIFGGTTFGLSVNNSPTLQDPFNTLPAWRFPFVASDLAPSPAHTPLIDGTLSGRVVGAVGYAYNPSSGLYAEAGLYGPLSRGGLETIGVYDPSDPGPEPTRAVPYGRLAWFQDLHGQSVSIGAVAMNAELRDIGTLGPGDRFTDLGLDAAWQWLGNRRHVVTLAASYVHEIQQLDGTLAGGGADHAHHTLDAFDMSASYYYDKTWGLTGKYFLTTGSPDTILYDPSGKPDSSGFVVQGDWTPFGKEDSWGSPWANVRVGLQYTAYTKFDGRTRGASDNDTLLGFVWTAF